MLAFAENEFVLGEEQPDGGTLRQHLEIAARQTSKIPEELKPVPCPDLLTHAWGWFCELDGTRSSNGFGANPISYGEIDAWAKLTDQSPTPFDIRAITSIDRVFRRLQAAAAKKRRKK